MTIRKDTPAEDILVELLKAPKLYLERRAYDYTDQFLDLVFTISNTVDTDIDNATKGDLKVKVEARFCKENISAYDNSILLKPTIEEAMVTFNIITTVQQDNGEVSRSTHVLDSCFNIVAGERSTLVDNKLSATLLLEALIIRVFPNIYSNRLN